MTHLWCIANAVSKSVEKNLFVEQVAQRIILTSNSLEIEDQWLVWSPGWKEWKRANEVTEVVQEVRRLHLLASQPPPPLPKDLDVPPPPLFAAPPSMRPTSNLRPTSTVEVANRSEGAEEDNEQSETWSGPSRRKHERISMRLRCIIRSSNITFRTFTKNISLGGVALEHEIPRELIGSDCQIYISGPQINKNLKFKISLTQRQSTKYFSFRDAELEFLEELQQWLTINKKLSTAAAMVS